MRIDRKSLERQTATLARLVDYNHLEDSEIEDMEAIFHVLADLSNEPEPPRLFAERKVHTLSVAIDTALAILESCYAHDANGNRVDGESDYSAADIVDMLCRAEGALRKAERTVNQLKKA